MQCPWKIHWGSTQQDTTQCGRDAHEGDEVHRGMHPNPKAPDGYTLIQWHAGDRREYTGAWPGECLNTAGCVLHTGHHGRCAV